MRQLFSIISVLIILVFSFQTFLFSRESYEDYLDRRYDKVNDKRTTGTRDKPLSEIRAGEREELLDDLRNAVRDVITSYSIHYTKLYDSHTGIREHRCSGTSSASPFQMPMKSL